MTLTPVGGGSPFDQIRRVDEAGEWWSARELMPLLGYGADWRNFESAVTRAKIAAENTGSDVASLFGGVTENSGGRPRANFRLARFACYLVALNGDPRKLEIAAAQAYFAVRTREAEVQVEQPAADMLSMARRLVLEADRADAAEAKLAEVARLLRAPAAVPPAYPALPPQLPPAFPGEHPDVALIELWVRTCTGAHAFGTSGRVLHQAFAVWFEREHGRPAPTEARFGRALTALGYPAWQARGRHLRALKVVR